MKCMFKQCAICKYVFLRFLKLTFFISTIIHCTRSSTRRTSAYVSAALFIKSTCIIVAASRSAIWISQRTMSTFLTWKLYRYCTVFSIFSLPYQITVELVKYFRKKVFVLYFATIKFFCATLTSFDGTDYHEKCNEQERNHFHCKRKYKIEVLFCKL